MLYQAYQAHVDMMWSSRTFAKLALPAFNLPLFSDIAYGPMRKLAAAYEVFALAEVTHHRPEFGIGSIKVGRKEVAVTEEAVHATPFGTLLHFRKDSSVQQPRVLLIAPMSGHFATLLRETVRTLLPEHDVYITDWHNARDIPLADGRFGIDEYIDHLMDFMRVIGPEAHMMAICQPCVPALSAVALMAEDNDPNTPLSLTLMAGPIDCRINPTEVNELATSKPIEWFARNLVSTVPLRYAGGMRRVYPGFLQLTAFMNMNMDRHVNSFRNLFNELVEGDAEKAESKRSFYEEYFAVTDLTAEFYLETVQKVFQEYALAKGELTWHGRPIRPEAIRRTVLLTVEGERDDICSLGQTLAAQDLCSSLRPHMRTHYVQPDVGHYGVFNGSRWNNAIYPVVRDVIHASRR
ncbi:MAG: polyhydroxyalkanoate depolymerase [Ectothiorhodospiraceae bacterium]|nr:polyhydroxyalkanoate depolymerase [Ectothiorhodospiraceae bacterium]MCH8505834.1 polyhydroxyalkanoate depolymerase [Ectothiorhodospiraceae bacterium]